MRIFKMLLIICVTFCVHWGANAWVYTFCNDTSKPVAIDAQHMLPCLKKDPKINYLAPKSCVIVDNSGSWHSSCCMRSVNFTSIDKKDLLESFSLPRCWDYTYIIHDKHKEHGCLDGEPASNKEYCWQTKRGTYIPQGCSVVAILKVASSMSIQEIFSTAVEGLKSSWLGVETPFRQMSPAENLGRVIYFVGSLAGAFGYDALQALTNSCYIAGKYMVITPVSATNKPLSKLYEKNCDESCMPKKDILQLDQDSICGYELVQHLSLEKYLN